MSMTMTAPLPRLVPRMKRATGSIATIRTIKGMLRKKFTNRPSSRFTQGGGADAALIGDIEDDAHRQAEEIGEKGGDEGHVYGLHHGPSG